MNVGYLRKATEQDTDLLFQWANEKSVRDHAFSTKKIAYKDHIKWFKEILYKDDAMQYIYMHDGQAVGQVRVNCTDIEAEIDYSICAEKRGLGYGRDMIGLLYEQVRQDFPQIKKLTAKVKINNIASHRVFLNTGYKNVYSVYEMEIEKESWI